MNTSCKLGRTGFDVSRVGFGTWQIGGGRWKGMTDDDSVRLIRSAVDRGVNIFDVAWVYGQYRNDQAIATGRSLELLGKAISSKELRESTYICLKLGQIDEYSHQSDYSPRRVVEHLQQSLALLRRDAVDICLIHAPSISEVEQARSLAVVETLKAVGMARAIGYSFENEPAHVSAALKQPIDVVMLQFNLIDRECESVLADAWRRGVGVLVGGPYKRGYLSGRYRDPADLPAEDNYWDWNLKRNRDKVEQTLSQVRAMLDGAGSARELRRMALAHILKYPAVASAIIGHREYDEIHDNLALVDGLVAEELETP